ncbi:aminotransferase class III-fold pyridoxal phosphate-dependent enzyme [Saccharothrix obliqua]|uniref:aminotransferase class III-fold pyridoxal phosphate-dependent enzyme n=1 Tax=Saccharothrix obliqua TaxID=2861747 RepID=UPI001C5CF317|nr:aminotransferase class III-fold pyridoxal phosphate-dependent enzyme [Saccharothrix obliqua]MBW4717838.1 aminotransferase class III-fold pyridoxal phosphate-dependent enzyme [Saccharothrix obliqua]
MTAVAVDADRLGIVARDRLLRGYSRHTTRAVPLITRGEGCHVWDGHGRRYLDAVSGAFLVQVGHGRVDLVERAVRRTADLGYFPVMERAHPVAAELAERLTADGGRVFLSSGGAEAVESAWKFAKQYFKAIGQPARHKVIRADWAYHGGTLGALAAGGLPGLGEVFGPLPPGGSAVPVGMAAEEVDAAIEADGPDTVAAVIVEPLSRPSGCRPPAPGNFAELRRVCDRHGVLLIADEVICGAGRLGALLGGARFGLEPDITCLAKGLTSGYAPLGATLVSEPIAAAMLAEMPLLHGCTYSGHPLAAAVALENLAVVEALHEHVLATEDELRATLEELTSLPVVRAVHGAGYLYALELQRGPGRPLTAQECARLGTGWLADALFDAGLHCRAGDHGQPYVHIAPPLIAGPAEFAGIHRILAEVLGALD